MASLYDQVFPTPTGGGARDLTGSLDSTEYILATGFVPLVSGFVTGAWFFAPTVDAPSNANFVIGLTFISLGVGNPTSFVVAAQPVTAPNAGDGWVFYSFAIPIPVIANAVYQICVRTNRFGFAQLAFDTNNSPVLSPSGDPVLRGFTDDPPGGYPNGAFIANPTGISITQIPNLSNEQTFYGVDVEFVESLSTSVEGSSENEATNAVTAIFDILGAVQGSSELESTNGVSGQSDTALVNNDPTLPLQTAVFARLSADGSLSSKVSGVFDYVPEDASYPYVRIGDTLSVPDNAHGRFGRNFTMTIHTWTRSRGISESAEIARDIIRILDHQQNSLQIEGHNCVMIKWEFHHDLKDPDPEIRHRIDRFRILTEQDRNT